MAVPDRNFKSCKVHFIRVAVWIRFGNVILGDNDRVKVPVPVIVLVCQSPIERQRLGRHFAVDFPHGLRHLIGSPICGYMDLSFVLSHWHEVWKLAAGSIILRDAQLTREISTPSFLDLTRHLYHDCYSLVMFQEGLRLHINAIKAFKKIRQSAAYGRTEETFLKSTRGGFDHPYLKILFTGTVRTRGQGLAPK